ncbi:MAG: hypothetical protein U0U66_08365 [Cytophagaceae bacterium]
MKKIIYIVFILFAIAMFSCSKKTSTYPGRHNQQKGNTCLGGC